MSLPCRLNRLLLPLAAAGCLLGSACDPVPPPPVARPVRFKAPPAAPPRRTEHPETETSKWLAAWRDTRARVAELQAELDESRKFYSVNQLDHFLYLDPELLSADQLCQLFHFLERGYFTVERHLLIGLLERRLNRDSAAPAIPGKPRGQSTYKERIAAAMQRDELRIVDIEGAIRAYQEPGDEAFRIPQSLSGEELAELRESVAEMLDETREKVTGMDRRIATLKARAFNLPEPPDDPEEAPRRKLPPPAASSPVDLDGTSEPTSSPADANPGAATDSPAEPIPSETGSEADTTPTDSPLNPSMP